ncbi:hypothetical protein PQX77_001233 [Marasmius sp. AFHP31]|nr:hypothetical protein PQX77_001233 [Marasmius sp. AFHP31]
MIPRLALVLQQVVTEVLSEGGHHADGLVSLSISNALIPLLAVELKRSLKGGGCDFLAQAAYPTLTGWRESDVSLFLTFPFTSHTRQRELPLPQPCPTFILAGDGSHLVLLGAVWADRFIVQHLTDMVYIGYDSTCHYDQIHKVARLFTVIRDSLADLANYYREVDAINQRENPQPLNPHEPHPRFFPQGRKYFCRQHKKLFALRYIRAIDDTDCCNLVYVAETDDQREVLIKFSDRYGYEAHQLLADKNWAPALYYVGLIDGSEEHDVRNCVEARGTTREWLYEGPGRMHGGWIINKLPPNGYQQLEVVGHFHEAGYVSGDLRRPNVIFSPGSHEDSELQARLIDFDWSGMEGEVFYPAGLSTNARWTEAVMSFKEIKKVHDQAMLKEHFAN